MLSSILSTKLFIPEIRGNYILRKSLVENLTNGINSGKKLTLVSGPAGYGKTTLILELLKSIELARAWISLDESDNDIVQFFSYLIAALKKAGVVIGAGTQEMAGDFSMSSTNAPIGMIINDISVLPERVILVLDDFHFIHSAQVNDAVKYLLERQPPNLHLVIITREDPALPLARIRAQGSITEIRMKDLRFTTEETAVFFQRVMGLNLSGEAIDAISARTEGWIAGLQLAGLSLSGCEEQGIEEFIRVLHDTHRYIVDYLVEEVINCQTEEVRTFLCKTSILDRMNGELCDAAVGRSGSSLLLHELEKSNLFLIPLDSKREWYRYHHLFADSLRLELSKDEEMQIHRNAALWLENNGFKQEATDHAFRSGDMALSLRLVESGMEQAFRNAQLMTFLKWVKLLPDELVRNSEILSVRKAWVLLMIGNGNGTQEYIDSLGESFLEKATPHNKGLLFSLKAVIAQYSGQGDAEMQAEEALRYLEPWDIQMRIAALNALGRAQEDNGKIADAVETLRMAYKECRKLGYTFVTTLTLMNLGKSLNGMGRRKEGFELFTEYINGMISEFGKPLPFIGIIYIGIAGLLYESDELEKAKFYMNEGWELCQSIFFHWIENKGILEARIQFALGEWESAIGTIKKSIDETAEESPRLLILNIAVLLELLLRMGRLDEAAHYEKTLRGFIDNKASTAYQEAYLPYIRLLICQNRKQEALEQLEHVGPILEKMQKGKDLITFYILSSKECFLGGDYKTAKACFEKAMSLAESQGYYRLFIDEEPIIRDIISSGIMGEGAFLKKIANCMMTPPSQMNIPGSMPVKRTEPEQKKMGDIAPFEKLSQREAEILELLGKGMSNDEIAKKLYISINTTQWHISHIYSKLGVRSRTQAVLKAKELEIQ